MSFSGFQGGPFTPSSFSYQLSASACCVNYSITGVPNWLTPSSTVGTVATSTTTVSFSINGNANTLPPGSYLSAINIANTTSSFGSASRSASLTVNRRPSLSVKPETRQLVTGPVGGPFNPDRVVYKLFTDQGFANWKLSGVSSWLTAKPAANGTVGAVKEELRLVLNGKATHLAKGRYRGDLVFKNLSNPSQSPLGRVIVLEVGLSAPSAKSEAIYAPR